MGTKLETEFIAGKFVILLDVNRVLASDDIATIGTIVPEAVVQEMSTAASLQGV